MSPVKFIGVVKFSRLMRHTAQNFYGSFRAWLREALLHSKGVVKEKS